MIPLYVGIGAAVLLLLWFVMTYNRLVRLRNQVDNSWSQIDVQLKRRHDLIPNLIETAKGYMKHERETLEAVTKARNIAAGAGSVGVFGRRGLLGGPNDARYRCSGQPSGNHAGGNNVTTD